MPSVLGLAKALFNQLPNVDELVVSILQMCLSTTVTKAFLPGILSISAPHSTISCSNKTDAHHICSNTGKQPTNHCYLSFS